MNREYTETKLMNLNEQKNEKPLRTEVYQGGEQWEEALGEGIALVGDYVQEGQERVIKGVIASVLEDAYYSYRQRGLGAIEFGEALRDYLKDIQIPAGIDRVHGKYELAGKRQPGFEESIEATLERFYFIERLKSTFGEKIDGVIVGGSMSYGPFFNVRSGEDSSDVDAIMIMGDDFLKNDEWMGLANSEILTDEDKAIFLHRKKLFTEMYQKGEVDIFSQRFMARDGDFNMSTHIMSQYTYRDLFGEGLRNNMLEGGDKAIVMRDYKPSRFERSKCDHQSFDGRSIDFAIAPQEKVTDGYVASIPAYLIDNNQYLPGLYQCLLLPSTLLVFDKFGDVSEVAANFTQLVIDRVEAERRTNPTSSLINAFPRKPILAPGRYEAIEVGR